ncbi:MAG: RHS repeat protein [Acidobacteria bacterium ACB2]|nr:RHS repeat protein [Acidobacteria bacterium ACB2]
MIETWRARIPFLLSLSCLLFVARAPALHGGLPINVGSGDASHQVHLFTISQEPLSLSFSLAYHSMDPLRPASTYQPMRAGWSHTFSESLVPVDSGGYLLYHLRADGTEVEYALAGISGSGAKTWRSVKPADVHLAVTLASSEWTVTDLNGMKTVFDANSSSASYGRWLRTQDRWGNTITAGYTNDLLTTVTDTMGREITLGYDTASPKRLIEVALPGGTRWAFEYDGTTGRLVRIFDPLHTSTPYWRRFAYVDDSASQPRLLSYVYDEADKTLVHFTYDSQDRAVGCSAEGGTDSYTVQYATPSSGKTRVLHTIDATTSSQTDYSIEYKGGRYRHTQQVGVCGSCGSTATGVDLTYDAFNNVTSRKVGTTGEIVETRYEYDGNGVLTKRTEAYGTSLARDTSFAHTIPSWPAFVTTVTEVSVKSGANKTTTSAWSSGETVLTTTVTGYLSPTAGSSTSYTTTTSFDSNHRVTSVTGPRTNQQTTFQYFSNTDTDGSGTYNRRGRLQALTRTTKVSPSATLATSYDAYDLYGTARSVTDPNAVETQRTIDARGRVLTMTEKKPSGDSNEPADYVTTYTYDSRDRLTQVEHPAGNRTKYVYQDGTNRLTDTIRADSSGLEHERLHLTLNLAGKKVQEDAQSCGTPATACTNWQTASRTESFVFDSLDRLSELDHPDATKVYYGYDSRGNLASVRDERHSAANTIYGYDALNRLTSVTQKRTIVSGSDVVTQYGYDRRDNLTSVTDPNLNSTTYTFDDWSRMATQSSPVSGSTSYIYDAAGNLTSSTDANGATTDRTYDLIDRFLTATSIRTGYTTETVTNTYDDATSGHYGKDRLATMEGPSGSTAYLYERRGLVRSEAHVIDGSTYTATYGYDPNRNRTMVTYPSGRVVDYTFDFADRPLTAAASSPSSETYVSEATYAPFGPFKTLTFGNGTRQTFTVDTRYMPYQNILEVVSPSSTLADFSYTHDGGGNIKAITDNTDSSYSRSYGYDDLNRLITANTGSSLWGTDSGNGYTYDAMGNMLSLTLGSSHTATFSYSGTTSLLSSVTEDGVQLPTVTYDSAGNESIAHEGYTAHYSTRNLTDYRRGYEFADMIQYSYDGRGVRVFSRATISWPLDLCDGDIRDEVSVYSPELNLLYRRIALTPDCEQPDVSEGDFVWFGGRPVAEDRPRGPVRWLFADHLGTPIVGTDSSAAVDFQVEYEPFGSPLVLRVGDTPSILQFPGQEATFGFGDRPLTYNIFRWYHANWGRYTQPDPIGATSNQGGLRLFPARQVGPVAVPSPGGSLFSYAEGNPTRLIDPTGEQAIAWALPAAGGCAIADGPLPVGDVIGAILLAGAIVYDASRERTCEGECSERDARCDRQLKDDEQRCTGWWKMRRNPNYGNYHACMGSAMFRYSECLRFGFPISPLSPTPFQR